jgi:hypothetical protein
MERPDAAPSTIAEDTSIKDPLMKPVPSLAGLVVLKLFAWLDRRDGKDVQDIRRLLKTYTDAGNVDHLYEEEAKELELVGFDTVLAGAYLLGKEAQRATAPTIRNKLSTALIRQEYFRTRTANSRHHEHLRRPHRIGSNTTQGVFSRIRLERSPLTWLHPNSTGTGIRNSHAVKDNKPSDTPSSANNPRLSQIGGNSAVITYFCFSFLWRPRRDLNPCYRRERAVS